MVRGGFTETSPARLEFSTISGASPLYKPQGRLTLTTATPVLTVAASAQGTVFYTPHEGNLIPLQLVDGSQWGLYNFSELSCTLSDATKSPAAAGANAAYDFFVWNDAGTLRLSRGPAWAYSATITVTIATPGVVTWTTHGLTTGMIVRFGTTGALPTGITAGTDYFLTVVDANSFKLSTTMANLIAGTFVNTSGTQSGVHTGLNQHVSRGTGAGTTELKRVNGVLVNANAISNGPGVGLGLYVGSCMCDSSGGTVSYDPGSLAAGGGTAKFNLWNAYNRVQDTGNVRDSSAAHAYTTATPRVSAGNANNHIEMMRGLQADKVLARFQSIINIVANGGSGALDIGLDTPLSRATATAFASTRGPSGSLSAAGAGAFWPAMVLASGDPGLGWRNIYGLEEGDGTNANTFGAGFSQLEASLAW